MRAIDLIEKKKRGLELSKEEINFLVDAYCKEEVKGYQMAAFLMAVCFKGMSLDETTNFTLAIRDSGDRLREEDFPFSLADKHSTGGVGDKTTGIVMALAAAAGVKICKMSGRGLGHTGGTIDKFESIPGFTSSLDEDKIYNILRSSGICILGQTKNLAPADKKIYALRDVTATVDSIPLIASSIMGKKLASPNKSIVLDVKCGSGAFMKDLSSAEELAKTMVAIGKKTGRKVRAIISNMDQPLGQRVENRSEIAEMIRVLDGKGPSDIKELSLELASHMISLDKDLDIDKAREIIGEKLEDKSGLKLFYDLVKNQGGDLASIEKLDDFEEADFNLDLLADKSGYISRLDAELIGKAASVLGAGRENLEDSIDFSASVFLNKKIGDRLEKGDKILSLKTSKETLLIPAMELVKKALTISNNKTTYKLIYKIIE